MLYLIYDATRLLNTRSSSLSELCEGRTMYQLKPERLKPELKPQDLASQLSWIGTRQCAQNGIGTNLGGTNKTEFTIELSALWS